MIAPYCAASLSTRSQADATIKVGDLTGCNQYETVCVFVLTYIEASLRLFSYRLAQRHIRSARLRIAPAYSNLLALHF